jgi:hypothetical protein
MQFFLTRVSAFTNHAQRPPWFSLYPGGWGGFFNSPGSKARSLAYLGIDTPDYCSEISVHNQRSVRPNIDFAVDYEGWGKLHRNA